MSEDEFDTPSDQDRPPCGPRRRVVRNGDGTSPNRRHRPRSKPPEPPESSSPPGPSVQATPGQDAHAGPAPTKEPETWDTAETRRGAWLRYLWFRPGHGPHNTVIAAAYITAGAAITVALVPVATSAVGSVFGERGGGAPSRRVASIVHTPRETYAYEYPSLSSKRAKPRGIYKEGDTIEVVCQIRDGEPVSDPGDGRPNYAVSAWDRLANGSWVPDIYTSLGHKRGAKPPPGIELCPDPPSEPAPAP